MIIECTHCHTRVIVDDSRICPSCRKGNPDPKDAARGPDDNQVPSVVREEPQPEGDKKGGHIVKQGASSQGESDFVKMGGAIVILAFIGIVSWLGPEAPVKWRGIKMTPQLKARLTQCTDDVGAGKGSAMDRVFVKALTELGDGDLGAIMADFGGKMNLERFKERVISRAKTYQTARSDGSLETPLQPDQNEPPPTLLVPDLIRNAHGTLGESTSSVPERTEPRKPRIKQVPNQ